MPDRRRCGAPALRSVTSEAGAIFECALDGGASPSFAGCTSPNAYTYYLFACADDAKDVGELDETNNCLGSTTTIVVTRPDLRATAVSDPPANVLRGGRFDVTDTVRNEGQVGAAGSKTRYYLRAATGPQPKKLLTGTRTVPALAAGATSTGTVRVTVPSTTKVGLYVLLACADDLKKVLETDEGDNCLASTGTVQVQ